jgi:hypothetical protein
VSPGCCRTVFDVCVPVDGSVTLLVRGILSVQYLYIYILLNAYKSFSCIQIYYISMPTYSYGGYCSVCYVHALYNDKFVTLVLFSGCVCNSPCFLVCSCCDVIVVAACCSRA